MTQHSSEPNTIMTAGLPGHDRSVQVGYLLAVIGCAVAVLIRLFIEPVLGNTSQFIVFYFAVGPAAIIGGLRPGLLATLLAALLGVLVLLVVTGPSGFDSAFALRMLLFVLSGIMISMIAQRSVSGWRLASRRLAEIRSIYQSAPVGMCLLDTDLRYRAINQSLAATNGHPVEAHLGRLIHEMLPPEIVAQVEPPIREAMASGRPVINHEIEGRHCDAEGRRHSFLASYSPVYAEDQRLLGVSVILQDLTLQRQDQQKLQESESRLRAIFDNAGVGIIEVTDGDHLVAVNERACQILGYSAAQLQQMNVHELTWPEDRALSDQCNARIHEGRVDRITYEKRYRHADGTPVWVHVTISAVRDEAGRWLRSITTIQDISQRKEAEESLRRRTHSLQLLSDCATRLLTEDRPEQVLRQSFDKLAEHLGLETYFNYLVSDDGTSLRLKACAGVDKDTCRKLLHLRMGELVCGQVAQCGESVCLEDIQHGTDPRTELLRGLGLQVYACNPLLVHGKVIGTLSFGSRQRDSLNPEELKLLQTISNQIAMALERARLLDELHHRAGELAAANTGAEAARHAAEQANAAKDHFLAVLSHELRTPLTPVVTTAGLLEQDPELPARYSEDIAVIRRNVELEARLIDDLLDVTRITRSKLELNCRVVPLCDVIRQAVEVCAPDIDARGVHFGIDMGAAAPYYVNADPARLQQVFWNLLKNAVKFTHPGGRVGIRCSREENQVLIEVYDSGKGIDASLLPHIFRPFEQGGAQVTREFGGLGLGLTITKGLVELHSGTIEARSDGPGKGSCFLLRFPLAAETPEALRAAFMPGTACALPPRKLRILMVEDHGDTARIMKRVLTADGYEVETAGDVASALDCFGRYEFDLLLSDLGLPDGSGTDVVRALRQRGEHGRSIPAIALSGYGRDEDIRRSKEAGFNEHLVKPVDIARLKQTIRRYGQQAR